MRRPRRARRPPPLTGRPRSLATLLRRHRAPRLVPEPPIEPPPGRIVHVPGRGEFFLRDSGGDGPALLLLHGWMVSADLNWITVYDSLRDAGYRVLALDHRGHGRGLRGPAPFRLVDCADDAAAILRHEGIDRALAVGYTTPTPIQAEAIAPLVEGRDLHRSGRDRHRQDRRLRAADAGAPGRAAPEPHRPHRPFGLVLAPTRELALQVAEAITSYGRGMGARVLTVYGGAPVGPQLRGLSEGVDVVVATPGRAIDLMNRGALRLDELEVVVLDEADEMLDMGFVEDIETLLDATPDTRQARAVLRHDAARASRTSRATTCASRSPCGWAARWCPTGAAPLVRQTAYLVPRTHTTAALGRVLEAERPKAAIVFCRTRLDVDAVTETLTARGLRAEALHGGMDQEHRSRVVDRLRSGRTELLVATDVAARGLDIDLLTHVVNHDVPQSPETYVHRIGRVGRAGREGVAITLVPPSKTYMLRQIERLTRQPIEIAPVPTAADLRAARLARTRDALAARLLGEVDDALDGAHLDAVRAMIVELAADFDPVDIAAVAVGLAQEVAGAPDDADDIPVVTARAGGRERDAGPRGRGGARRAPARRGRARRACSSTPAAPAACVRRTSWARWPTSRA